MENDILETLTHCYSSSSSLVLIMDMQWQILWTNRTCENLAKLPQQLGISESHTENSVHRFCYDGSMHECRLLCNEADGYRIAEIYPCTEETDIRLRLDTEAVTASVQAMTSACHTLRSELDALESYDQLPLLNTLIGSCYRIYRTVYLQKELDRLQGGYRRNVVFSVKAALQTLLQKCNEILRICLETDMDAPSEDIYLKGDMDEFQMAVLSAITLCCMDSDHIQRLHIELQPGDGLVCLRLHAEQTPAELPQQVCRLEDMGGGHCEGERAILSLFCRRHGGKWLLTEQAKEGAKTCSIYFRPHTGEITDLTLHSPRDLQEGRFFNKYEIMLSRIHYRRMF